MPTGVDFRSDTCTLWDYFTHKMNELINGFSSMKVPKPLMYLQDHFPEAINLEFTSNN